MGKKVIDLGWKKYSALNKSKDEVDEDEEQEIDDINPNKLTFTDVVATEKSTRPPKAYNEASILSFMENPRNQDENNTKLVGLGTPATRHTFIPKLVKKGYITVVKNAFSCTPLGSSLLKVIRNSSIKALSDIATTTRWEENMETNPVEFEEGIKSFIKSAVSNKPNIDQLPPQADASCDMKCPICGKPVKENKLSYYCTGYKDGCSFKSIWKSTRGTTFTKTDAKALLLGKKTSVKKCTSKEGKSYECRFTLDKDKGFILTPIFEASNKEKGNYKKG